MGHIFDLFSFITQQRKLTKFSEMKRSSIVRLVAKICLPEVVAMETVTHSLFFSMTDISAGGEAIVLKSWQCVLLKQRFILSSEHNFQRLNRVSDTIKQNFRQCPVDLMAYFTVEH